MCTFFLSFHLHKDLGVEWKVRESGVVLQETVRSNKEANSVSHGLRGLTER